MNQKIKLDGIHGEIVAYVYDPGSNSRSRRALAVVKITLGKKKYLCTSSLERLELID